MSTNPVTVASINPQDEKLTALRSLFPEAFREGKLDTTLLSAALGEPISNERESYGMSWAGKSDARRQIVTPTTKSLSPDESASVDFTNTNNILIEGDNLEVLRLLQKSYTKQVKMIYIDPPYNTGKDFVYHDNFHTSTREYGEASGQRDSEGAKLVQNTETNGRYHSDWLSMMYPRLHLARNLLRDDGVIFVSIDDHEVHNLRKVMDEIFGEENYLGIISVVNNLKGRSDDEHIATANEFLIVFAKNKNMFEMNGFQLSEHNIAEYDLEDSYGKYKEIGFRKTGKGWRREDRPNMYYPIYFSPDTQNISLQKSENALEILPLTSHGEKGRWRWGIDTFNEKYNRDIVIRQVRGNKYSIFTKMRLQQADGEERTLLPKSLWIDPKFDTSKGGKELKNLFETTKEYFENPKPIMFLHDILIAGSNSNDLILDFFAGSGTTGHAVMVLNAEEKAEAIKNRNNPDLVGNRRYICVQLDEMTDEKSEAYKAGYKQISEITAERLRRAGKKIKEENPSVSFDNGFRLYRLTPSCYQVASVEYDSEDSQGTLESLERAIQSGISPLREGVSEADVIVENLIKEGFLINSRLDSVQICDNHFLYAEREGKQIFISFEDTISLTTVQALTQEYKEAIFVVYDRALDDSRKVMISDRVKLRTI